MNREILVKGNKYMGNRAVKQPNGLYARFSEVVDDFTHVNCSREDMWRIYHDEAGEYIANEKLENADKNPDRFDEAIKIIHKIHGEESAKLQRMELSEHVNIPKQNNNETKIDVASYRKRIEEAYTNSDIKAFNNIMDELVEEIFRLSKKDDEIK